jgi:glycosyltransferase involved in cell wall biosynthesis
MKILMMDPVKPLDRDGSMVHRWELARNLANQGCEVHIITYTDIIPERVQIHPLPKKSKIRYIMQLPKLVMKHQFDIIYTRNILRGVIGILIKKVWKSELVLEVNGISLDEWRLVEEQSITEKKGHRNAQIKFLGYLEIFVIRKADAVIIVTQGIEDYLINHGVDKNKVWVIENGANTELFKPIRDNNILKGLKNRLHITDDENVVVFVGNLAPWQGVEYLLRAVPLIVEENPKTKFLIVGDGIMKEKLESLTKELNIRCDVIFTGTVPYESVPEYMNLSDVCVAPFIRTRNESMGLSPLKIYEYLACGTPVVASDIKGVGDLLESSNSGIPVIPDNPNELAKAIIKLLNDKQLREQMGKNGREMVVSNYSWENTAKKTIEVFESILD